MRQQSIDLTGKTFGRLFVLHRDIGRHTKGLAYWICQCSCVAQTIKSVAGSDLRSGNTKSCGCTRKEKAILRNTTHGKSNHPLYGVWNSMRCRCYNPKTEHFAYYGGKGITMPFWKDDFQSFYEYAVQSGWMPGLTIDRIDTDGNYEPGNIRWIPQAEQAKNQSSNIIIDGVCLAEKCRQLDLKYNRVWWRIKKGWSLEKAMQ